MIVRLASVSSALLHAIIRTSSRIPPSLWLKLAVIVALIAVKQGLLP